MGIGAAFQIGRSALAASQLGVQVASNNLANAATPGYTRQTMDLQSLPGDAATQSGQIGAGVRFNGVRRQIDPAIEARLNSSISDTAAASEVLRAFSGIETILNELTDLDLSSELGNFFTGWSEIANGTQAQAQVVEQGELLAGFIQRLRGEMASQRNELNSRLGSIVNDANETLDQIATLNEQITSSESGGAKNNPLRDQRDQLLRDLSATMEVTAIEQASGAIDVLVGSTPVVLGANNQGIELRDIPRGDRVESQIAIKATGQVLDISSGQVGGLIDSRDGTIDKTIDKIDDLASQLIFEINKLHSTGANANGLTSAQSQLQIFSTDQSLSLNDPLNQSLQALPFAPSNGGFLVRTTDAASGAVTNTRIDIDLDGINAAGAPGFADDTSINDIAADINAIQGLTATVGGDGKLSISASPGTSFTFGEDSSGVLAVLGINSYFSGTDATDIAVDDRLASDPLKLMTGRYENDTFSLRMEQALSIAELQDTGLDAFEWPGRRARSGARRCSSSASENWLGARALRVGTALVSRQRGCRRGSRLSGVDTDEEAVNLLAVPEGVHRARPGSFRPRTRCWTH